MVAQNCEQEMWENGKGHLALAAAKFQQDSRVCRLIACCQVQVQGKKQTKKRIESNRGAAVSILCGGSSGAFHNDAPLSYGPIKQTSLTFKGGI